MTITVLLMIAAGSAAQSGTVGLTDGSAPARSPSWRPDGSEIAYETRVAANGRESWDIHVIDPVSGRRRVLIASVDDDRSATWSPDGLQLVYVKGQGATADLHVHTPDSGADRMLARLAGEPMFPA